MGSLTSKTPEHITDIPGPVAFEQAICNLPDPMRSRLAELRKNFVFLELSSTGGKGTAYGSGFVVRVVKGKKQAQLKRKSKVYILTCFHNVMKQNEGVFKVGHTNELRTIVGKTLSGIKFSKLIPFTWGKFQTYFEGADIAVLEGEQQFECNFQDIILQNGSIAQELKVDVFGFTDRLDSLAGAVQREAKVESSNGNLHQIKYKVKTEYGNSGAPVLTFNQQKGKFCIVGVHTGWISSENIACGVLISSELKSWVENIISGKAVRQLDAKELNLSRKQGQQADEAFKTHSMTVRAEKLYSSKVEVIALQDTGITSQTCKYIAQTFKGVRELYLRDNSINNKGLVCLILGLPQLRKLEARHNPITYEFIDQVLQNKRQLPQIQNIGLLTHLKLTDIFKGCSENQSIQLSYLSVLIQCFQHLEALNEQEHKQKEKAERLGVHLRSCYRGIEKAIREQLNQFGSKMENIRNCQREMDMILKQDKINFERSNPESKPYTMPQRFRQKYEDLKIDRDTCKQEQLGVMRKLLRLQLMKNSMDICRIQYLKKYKHLTYYNKLLIEKKQIELEQLEFVNAKRKELGIQMEDIRKEPLRCPYVSRCIS